MPFRFLLLTLLSLSLFSHSLYAEDEAPSAPAASKNSLPLDELYLFTEVYHQIRQHYVSEVDDKKLINLAIKGMLEGLDPHSSYLDQNDYKELKENTNGEFAGIGVEVSLENNQITVVAPIDNSPAKKAGILAGDIITQVDDIKVQSSNLEAAIEKMRGPKGSSVELSIIRGEKQKRLKFKIKRDIVKLQSVKSHFLEPGFAYLRISQFQKNTADEVNAELKKIAATKKHSGLIIDLRDNPGGVLHGAIDVSDLFLDGGLIVYTQGRNEESREEYHGTEFQLLENTPILILMNAGSASASEIVAGALQDRERAVVAGTQSFGKGSVQTILGLPQEKAMKLTTSRYYTPNGRSIQAEGITPDIIIHQGNVQIEQQNDYLSEADLSGHLDQETRNPKTLKATNKHLADDYQLQQALNLLKAMYLAP